MKRTEENLAIATQLAVDRISSRIIQARENAKKARHAKRLNRKRLLEVSESGAHATPTTREESVVMFLRRYRLSPYSGSTPMGYTKFR